jgi:hypothetical protein
MVLPFQQECDTRSPLLMDLKVVAVGGFQSRPAVSKNMEVHIFQSLMDITGGPWR